jgi:hypothetical protein
MASSYCLNELEMAKCPLPIVRFKQRCCIEEEVLLSHRSFLI